jgi:hypothetical protein
MNFGGSSKQSILGHDGDGCLARVEAVAEPRFDQVNPLVNGGAEVKFKREVAIHEARQEIVVLMAEVDVVILDLRRPISPEGVFEAGPDMAPTAGRRPRAGFRLSRASG